MICKILTYEEIDKREWKTLVEKSSTGTWFQTPEAYAFFASMPELFRPFVVAISNQTSLSEAQHSINPSLQTLRAICMGYVTKEKSAVKQYFTRRAIIIGGPVIANDATEEEVGLLLEGIRGLEFRGLGSPIYVETRNLNDYSRWKEAFEKAGFDYMPHLNFHIDPMVDNLSENRHRQVRQSNAEIEIIENKNIQNTAYADINIEKEENKNENTIREWYEILRELYRTKVKTPLWPEEFFLEAYRQGVGTFMMVKHNNRVIGGSMLVMGKEGTTYEWYACGQNRVYKDQHPSVMATWAGIQWAKEQGYTRYDMMGAGKPDEEYGVRDFKAEFGGEKVEHGRFLYVCKPMLYRFGKLGVKLLKKANN